MAITLITEPILYTPVNNPIVWVFNSSNKNECDFEYICDVYVNGVFATRLRAIPQGANDYGTFDIQRVLEDYLTYNFYPFITEYTPNPNSILSYYVEIRERYNTSTDCTGQSTLSSVLFTSTSLPVGEKYAWNSALQFQQYPSYTLQDYVSTTTYSHFLTNMPNGTLIGINDKMTIDFIQNADGSTEQVYGMNLRTYTATHSLINSYAFDNPYYIFNNQYELMLSIGVGPFNFNNMDIGTVSPQYIFTDNVKYYQFELYDQFGTPMSETKELEINTKCYKYNKYRLWWLNRLGGFDSYTFDLKSVRSLDIDRTTFDRYINYNYSTTDRGTTVVDVDAQENYSLTSNWLTEKESRWLEELFTSLEVYMVDDNELKVIQLMSATHETNNTANIGLNSVQLIATYSTFNYVIDDGSAIGMPNVGVGTILGYDTINNWYNTNVPSTINAGALITGTVSIYQTKIIPIVIQDKVYEEKIKNNIKNINYNINVKPSYKINTQSN